jgi:hypothetical protein
MVTLVCIEDIGAYDQLIDKNLGIMDDLRPLGVKKWDEIW